MHVSLTDLVTCPRCGPTYGLVLMPERVVDRRVVAGVMGCANCRERYRVEGGVADLRVPGAPDPAVGEGAASSAGEEPGAGGAAGDAVRLAALMGLAEATGTVLLLGPSSARAGEIAALVEGVEVVVAGSGLEVEPGGAGAGPSVSRLRVSDPIPLRSGSMRGVVLSGPEAGRLEEGARVVARGGRLVVEPAPLDAADRLEAAGLRVLAAEGGTVVAGR